MTTQFEIGRIYTARSICDYETTFRWKAVRRTAKSVWLVEMLGDKEFSEPMRRSINVYQGVETCKPNGTYSMCPVAFADKYVGSEAPKPAAPAPIPFPVKAKPVNTSPWAR